MPLNWRFQLTTYFNNWYCYVVIIKSLYIHVCIWGVEETRVIYYHNVILQKLTGVLGPIAFGGENWKTNSERLVRRHTASNGMPTERSACLPWKNADSCNTYTPIQKKTLHPSVKPGIVVDSGSQMESGNCSSLTACFMSKYARKCSTLMILNVLTKLKMDFKII